LTISIHGPGVTLLLFREGSENDWKFLAEQFC
jgi:hypothetical protein